MYDADTTAAQWHHQSEIEQQMLNGDPAFDRWLDEYDHETIRLHGEIPMANLDEIVTSKSQFMKKEDVGEDGRNLTIKGFQEANVGTDNQPEMRYVITWQEDGYKPMVLNVTNKNRLKTIFKTADTDQLIGKQVNVFNDPFVEFQGEMKGGLRVRPVQQATSPPRTSDSPPTPPVEAYENEVPF